MNLRASIWVLNVGLLILLGALAARQFVHRPPEAAVAPTSVLEHPTTPRSDAAPTGGAPVESSSRNIFGSSALGASQEAATASKLPLRLLGTIAGGPAVARAIIEEVGSHSQDLYKVGDDVKGARIESIARNRVILLRDGQREVLELSLAPGETPEPAPAPAASAPVAMTNDDIHATVKAISATDYLVSKAAMLARIGGIEDVFHSAKVEPYLVNGKTEGLQVTGLDGISVARFVGLENGDVIQSVNGQKLTSMQKAFQVFQKARVQPNLDVQLLRGQDSKTLSFRLGT